MQSTHFYLESVVSFSPVQKKIFCQHLLISVGDLRGDLTWVDLYYTEGMKFSLQFGWKMGKGYVKV